MVEEIRSSGSSSGSDSSGSSSGSGSSNEEKKEIQESKANPTFVIFFLRDAGIICFTVLGLMHKALLLSLAWVAVSSNVRF